MGEQSNSSIQIVNEEDTDDHVREDGPISVRPSPSPSPSKSISHSESPFISSQCISTITPSNHSHDDDNDNDDDDNVHTKATKPTNDNDSNNKINDGQTNILSITNLEDDEENDCLKEHSKSMSQCRYCYTDIPKKESVSQCHCSGVLCKECLINELKLCHGRNNSLLQCTVCKV